MKKVYLLTACVLALSLSACDSKEQNQTTTKTDTPTTPTTPTTPVEPTQDVAPTIDEYKEDLNPEPAPTNVEKVTLTINLKDKNDQPLADANICPTQINSSKCLFDIQKTDLTGKVIFQLPKQEYKFKIFYNPWVIKPNSVNTSELVINYAKDLTTTDKFSQATSTNLTQATTINIKSTHDKADFYDMLPMPENVEKVALTINLKDKNNQPMEDAVICPTKIDNSKCIYITESTDSNGQIVFELPKQEYKFKILYNGWADENDQVTEYFYNQATIADFSQSTSINLTQAETINIKSTHDKADFYDMLPMPENVEKVALTINLKDKNNQPMVDAVICPTKIDNNKCIYITGSTGLNGQIVFELPKQEYKFKILYNGWADENDQVTEYFYNQATIADFSQSTSINLTQAETINIKSIQNKF